MGVNPIARYLFQNIFMALPLLICLIFVALCVTFFVWGFIVDNREMILISIFACFIGSMIGFGPVCSENQIYHGRWPVYDFTYAKSKSAVLIEAAGINFTLTDARSFNFIDNAKVVYIIKHYNSYGNEVGGTQLEIPESDPK